MSRDLGSVRWQTDTLPCAVAVCELAHAAVLVGHWKPSPEEVRMGTRNAVQGTPLQIYFEEDPPPLIGEEHTSYWIGGLVQRDGYLLDERAEFVEQALRGLAPQDHFTMSERRVVTAVHQFCNVYPKISRAEAALLEARKDRRHGKRGAKRRVERAESAVDDVLLPAAEQLAATLTAIPAHGGGTLAAAVMQALPAHIPTEAFHTRKLALHLMPYETTRDDAPGLPKKEVVQQTHANSGKLQHAHAIWRAWNGAPGMQPTAGKPSVLSELAFGVIHALAVQDQTGFQRLVSFSYDELCAMRTAVPGYGEGKNARREFNVLRDAIPQFAGLRMPLGDGTEIYPLLPARNPVTFEERHRHRWTFQVGLPPHGDLIRLDTAVSALLAENPLAQRLYPVIRSYLEVWQKRGQPLTRLYPAGPRTAQGGPVRNAAGRAVWHSPIRLEPNRLAYPVTAISEEDIALDVGLGVSRQARKRVRDAIDVVVKAGICEAVRTGRGWRFYGPARNWAADTANHLPDPPPTT